MRLLKKLFKIFILLLLLAGFFLIGYYFAVTKNIVLVPEKLLLNENTAIVFDGEDKEMVGVSALFSKETATVDRLSKKTIFAFVDTEDKRFFLHSGFDVKRIFKAVFNNLKSRSFKEGASTISQQLIKNTHLTQQKTIKRKLQEIKLTYRLEKEYTKEEILEKYLNTIYFGHSCFGISSASRYYFNKTPDELTLSESAILAGLVKSPNNYSPFKNAEKCKNRRNLVLNLMENAGHISKEEKQIALNESLPTKPTENDTKRSYIINVFDELESLSEKYDFTLGGSIKIYTYLDSELQDTVKETAKQANSDISICILDNATRGIKAYHSTTKKIARLPASLIKPLLVYAPAIEENYLLPATPILDEKISFSGYEPKNYDNQYHGYVSAREALAKSFNVPAVKILNSVGIEKSIEYLNKMEMTISPEDYSLALALGGMRDGFTLTQLTAGYSTLAAKGEYIKPSFIRKIIIDNNTIYEQKTKAEKVFSDDTAYLTTDMLKTATKTGTAKKLSVLPFDVASKTGTNGTKNGNYDAYAISYTPLDTIGVWLGNTDNTPIEYTGGGLPCNISLELHKTLFKNYSKKNIMLSSFTQPNNIQKIAIDKIEYEKTHDLLLADPQSPKEYTLFELFKQQQIPKQQATHFSSPNIPPPTITVKNKTAIITFDIKTPVFYNILIEKHYYASHNTYVTHSTLYKGSLKSTISDKLTDDKSYIYSITPIYKENKGKTIYLPAVSIGSPNSIAPIIPPDISSKDWWNY